MQDIRNLKDLIREYEELLREMQYMKDAWDGDCPEEAAVSDPGLQYEKGNEIDDKLEEIKLFVKNM